MVNIAARDANSLLRCNPVLLFKLVLLLLLLVARAPGATAATPSFHTAQTCICGREPISVTAADFNRDGIVDLAVARYTSSPGYVTVLMGNGDGAFGEATDYKVDKFPRSVIAADFNRDNIADLAVANDFANSVSILLGNGDGSFEQAKNYAVAINPHCVLACDFNGDGNLDLAVANYGSHNISILPGKGDGSFETPVVYSAGNNPYSVAAADFNDDGNLDLAIANHSSSQNLTILPGNGDTTFQEPVTYSVAGYPYSLASGDFNDDGRTDLAAATYNSASISVLLGDGDFSFKAAVSYPVGDKPSSVVSADFNLDGAADLAAVNFGSNSVAVLPGNGDGTFQEAVHYSAGSKPISIIAADFNGDGKPDLATANNASDNLSILLNNTSFPGQLQFDRAAYSISEDTPAATITVTRSGGSDSVVGVTYRCTDGTASAGLDYQPASGSLILNDGETTKSFTVGILDDSEVEYDETVNLSLCDPWGGAVLGSPAAALLTIIDDEVPDTRPPQIINSDPPDKASGVAINKTITITFDEPLQPGSNMDTISLVTNSSTALYTYAFSNSTFVIQPLDSLAYSSDYTLTVPAGTIADLAGNTLAADFHLSFSTRAAPEPGNGDNNSPGEDSSSNTPAPVSPVPTSPPPTPQQIITAAQLQAATSNSYQAYLYWAAKSAVLAVHLLEHLGVNVAETTAITGNLPFTINSARGCPWSKQMLQQLPVTGLLQDMAPNPDSFGKWINPTQAAVIIKQVLGFASLI